MTGQVYPPGSIPEMRKLNPICRIKTQSTERRFQKEGFYAEIDYEK
jgi:hypothetical protein